MSYPVLMYHYLGDPVDPDDFPYWVTLENFKKQMDFLKNRRFHTISLQKMIDHFDKKEPTRPRSVVLTFDDGHISFYEHAFPVLKMLGFTATMFLIISKIGQKNYMDWEQIVEMQRNGFSFESHSITHPIITEINPEQAKEEISCSKEILEKNLESPIRFFAYRGGHFNDQIKNMVASSGYVAAVCSKGGYNDEKSDRFALFRIPIRRSDSLPKFSAKVFKMDPQRPGSRFVARHLYR